MHRSGTSLLGGVLHRLGVALPGEQIAGDSHNPEGYFEWREVVDLQERLLIDLDRWWPSAQGCLPLPQAWLRHPATQAARKQLGSLLHQEAAHQEGIWAIKDPRTSRLLPLWLELAAELAIPLRLLLAVRDPAEVACSLVNRDGAITGMDLGRAQQLCWLHNLEVIHGAPVDVPLAVVDFGCWFTQPESQLHRLLTALPELCPSAEQRQQALALIHPEHRRSAQAAEGLSLNPRVRRLHHQLLTPGRRRWPGAAPPKRLRQGTVQQPNPQVLAADPTQWTQWLQRWRHHPAPRHGGGVELAQHALISVCGLSLNAWQTHLWLQKLPIPGLDCRAHQASFPDSHNLHLDSKACAAPELPVLEHIALNLELPPVERAHHWLTHLRRQQAIWDPEPARVCLLRALDLPAYWLDPEAAANGWLQPHPEITASWGSRFGLPQPVSNRCLCLGHGGERWERALAAWETHSDCSLIHYLPELPAHGLEKPTGARELASWLMAFAGGAKDVVALGEASFARDPAMGCLLGEPLRHFVPPLTPGELLAELEGEPVALAEDRACPGIEQLFLAESEGGADGAVVISLFNYANWIGQALDSVAAQTLLALELVVVDDASTDHSVDVAKAWLSQHSSRFSRVLLLRHSSNAGLAAARNTAFENTLSEWVFVLDADNMLLPAAVGACLEQARLSTNQMAVVHPLVQVIGDGDHGHDGRSLVSRISWQRQAFLAGNVIDAMALVRRSAWQAVGGYTHIEGGWEDFDFWCKLIESGYHGVLCPRILARYNTHDTSMTATSTASNWRPLSRCLQHRHPWLELPYAH